MAQKPKDVPDENWLPINRKGEDIGAIMRVYVPDLEKMKTWEAPKAELVKWEDMCGFRSRRRKVVGRRQESCNTGWQRGYCDHFVYPEYRIGEVRSGKLRDAVLSRTQVKFGFAKSESLPPCCRRCAYLADCWGECPENRLLRTPEGETGLN